MPLRSPSRLLVACLLAGSAALTACSSSDGSAGSDPGSGQGSRDAQAVNPYADHDQYADPGSKAAQAAESAKSDGDSEREQVFSRLAGVPQGIWLTPEEYPSGSVGGYVSTVVAAADKAGQVPTFVIYGVPDRDCTGQHSAGGLPADEYGPWVGEIADAAGKGDDVAAVVEPDGLASLLECGDRDERVGLIADAAHRLAAAGVTTYLDGGHSHWIDPADLAPLLEDAGVGDVRGFSTNVSNFQSDQDEQKYGEELSGLLDGAHYVVDTGRNGFGATQDWCNPPGRAFGIEPGGASSASPHQDANVWVKPPGESDGECNGGPSAGQFWPERAMELASASGW
ncbi:glycoside hydrolase family 6 protein [Nocardioides conyzicola]|uniref:Glucanase n=1 Tax=Nocardioides conyzicola TaxID=1651781 RepID=A0ABP8WRG2_9ACTN